MIITHKAGPKVHLGTKAECKICHPPKKGSLTDAEEKLADMLEKHGWPRANAEAEAVRALAEAAVEDGYDGA
jgi:hypothetical protein